MKFFKNKILLVLIAILAMHTSCDDGFAEINTNPQVANSIDPGFQMTWVQLRTSGARYENWRAVLIYSSTMIQHFATTCGYWAGDKYTYNAGYSSSLIDGAYTQQVKDMQDLINTLESGEGDPTMLGMARIWRVIIFHRITDLYGDVPYFQAGKGALEGIDFPAYDSQDEIYADMLKELEEGIAQLASGGFGNADLIYGGDVEQWKRFGYSLMLRLGMRLSEVDPSSAQAWVTKAIAGGVMNSNADDAFIEHTNGPEGINRNGIGEVLDKANGVGDDCPRLSARMVELLEPTGDPRLAIFGIPAENTGEFAGMPNGLDETTIQDNPTGTSVDDFSRVNPIIVTTASPMMFMTYAETELLLAEAAVRGWSDGDAATHYNNGVRAAIKMWETYDASLAVDDAVIDEFLTNNSFDPSIAMQQIGEQYWLATFLNEYEAFSNYRRTGFPVLSPVDYDGNITSGQIPLRLAANPSEGSLNPNWQAAADRQGLSSDYPSHFMVSVWWDK